MFRGVLKFYKKQVTYIVNKKKRRRKRRFLLTNIALDTYSKCFFLSVNLSANKVSARNGNLNNLFFFNFHLILFSNLITPPKLSFTCKKMPLCLFDKLFKFHCPKCHRIYTILRFHVISTCREKFK